MDSNDCNNIQGVPSCALCHAIASLRNIFLYKARFCTYFYQPKHHLQQHSAMASHTQSQSVADKEIEVPEWEHTDNTGANHPPGRNFQQNLDSAMPPHKKYLGMRRKVFLIVLVAAILALLALIIGLAVGLTRDSKY